MARNASSEFDYKQRPFSRSISQGEWDAIFSHPAADRQADYPRSTPSHPQPECEGQSTVVDLGLRAYPFDGDMWRMVRELEAINAYERVYSNAYLTPAELRARA
jgi:hypothetical protein